jgi:hypothetical protein
MVGCLFIYVLLAHSVDLLLQPIAFGFCLLQHYLPAVPSVFLSVDLPGRSVLRLQPGSFLSIGSLDVQNIASISAFLFHGILFGTCAPIFTILLTQPSNERLAFYPVD